MIIFIKNLIKILDKIPIFFSFICIVFFTSCINQIRGGVICLIIKKLLLKLLQVKVKKLLHQLNRVGDSIVINGSYDVNIWYSYDNDTKTEVYKDTNTYQETVKVRKRDDLDDENEEIIIRSLKQPTCSKIDIKDNKVVYTIEKELGIELVGDTKVKIAVDENEDPWDEIIEDQEEMEKEIEEEVKEDFIDEETI